MAGVKESDWKPDLSEPEAKTRHMLVDGNNILIRAAKATQYAEMQSHGVSTSALHVFISMLARHVRVENPTHLVVCWDGGRSTYRTGLYDQYKAHRRERGHEDEEAPFSLAKRFLTLAGINHIERDGWEADDLIAAYWRGIPFSGSIVILSSDKDLLQLVGADTEQVRVSSKPPDDRWDFDRVVADLGCKPIDLPKVMALTGDPGDNVPGIHGVGPKKAVKALGEANWNLDSLLVGDDRFSPHREQVLRSLKLVNLRDLPYHMYGLSVARLAPMQETGPSSAGWGDLLAFVDDYELRQIRDRLIAGTLWREEASVERHVPGV